MRAHDSHHITHECMDSCPSGRRIKTHYKRCLLSSASQADTICNKLFVHGPALFNHMAQDHDDIMGQDHEDESESVTLENQPLQTPETFSEVNDVVGQIEPLNFPDTLSELLLSEPNTEMIDSLETEVIDQELFEILDTLNPDSFPDLGEFNIENFLFGE